MDTVTYQSDTFVFNSLERVFILFCITVTASLTAVIFGMVGATTKVLPEKFEMMYDEIMKIHTVMETTNKIPHTVRQRIEMFFKYVTDTRNENSSLMETLGDYLPDNLVT